MTHQITRRGFLAGASAVTGGVVLSGPLAALSARIAAGEPITSEGYGDLFNLGDLMLPEGFHYRIVSREGDLMDDGNPTPSRFDGMAAFDGPRATTILLRNHENRQRPGTLFPQETGVVVPPELRYEANPLMNGGVTKLVTRGPFLLESRAMLGGTVFNCAGGPSPWGSWITCEELSFQRPTTSPHGYVFEVDAYSDSPVAAQPIVAAGRFEHEAVAWHEGALYETEDDLQASFYRFLPANQPSEAGEMAAAGGILEALVVTGFPTLDTRLATGWPDGVGESHAVEWVTIPNPNPAGQGPNVPGQVRMQAQVLGAAIFARTEGCWESDGKIIFDCTVGGGTTLGPPPDGQGQVFQLDPAAGTLKLLYQSPEDDALARPDNIVTSPRGDLLLCEDNANATPDFPNRIMGLTPEGTTFPFAAAVTNPTEFCGPCFGKHGLVLYVNQQGNPVMGTSGVTYAIWGPWRSRRRDDDD